MNFPMKTVARLYDGSRLCIVSSQYVKNRIAHVVLEQEIDPSLLSSVTVTHSLRPSWQRGSSGSGAET
jgi:hypothetical protein